jgi:outer membrane immunogenic protein
MKTKERHSSRWCITVALLLAMCCAASRSSNAQIGTVPVPNTELSAISRAPTSLIATADAVPLANVNASESLNVAAAAPPTFPGFPRLWNGFYVGVSIGRASANGNTSIIPLPDPATFINLKPQTLGPEPTGPLGGLQIGVNKQLDHLLLGVEADVNAAGIDGTTIESPIIQNNGTPFPGVGNNITVHQRTDTMLTLRPRVGLIWGRRIVTYATAGLAVAHVGYHANTDFRPAGTVQYTADVGTVKLGWTAGGGVEFTMSGHWSFKGELLQYELGSQSFTADPSIPLPPFQVKYIWQTSGNFFRFGVNYKF